MAAKTESADFIFTTQCHLPFFSEIWKSFWQGVPTKRKTWCVKAMCHVCVGNNRTDCLTGFLRESFCQPEFSSWSTVQVFFQPVTSSPGLLNTTTNPLPPSCHVACHTAFAAAHAHTRMHAHTRACTHTHSFTFTIFIKNRRGNLISVNYSSIVAFSFTDFIHVSWLRSAQHARMKMEGWGRLHRRMENFHSPDVISVKW